MCVWEHVCACVCLISLNSAWLGLWGTIFLKPLSHINHHHKVTNNPVMDKTVKAALNTALFVNNYCNSYIKAWAMRIIWGPIVPRSACNAQTQHTYSWPCPQLHSLFMLLPGRSEFIPGPWSLAIWVKSLSSGEEQCYWVQPLAANTYAHAQRRIQSCYLPFSDINTITLWWFQSSGTTRRCFIQKTSLNLPTCSLLLKETPPEERSLLSSFSAF